MSNTNNVRKSRFLASFPVASLDLPEDSLARRCKFNFSYMEKQAAGQDFSDWTERQLSSLFEKLCEYSKESLQYWTRQPVGKSGSVLSIYGQFPARSEFQAPKHVPHQARWGRFRLEHAVRLVGFVLPPEYHEQRHLSGDLFDCNTFYVVFLDENHAFYPSIKD